MKDFNNSKSTKFSMDAVRAVTNRAAQKMTEKTDVKKSKAGRKKVEQKAEHKITLNLTPAELEKFMEYCNKNGMKPAAAIRYCLTKQEAL